MAYPQQIPPQGVSSGSPLGDGPRDAITQALMNQQFPPPQPQVAPMPPLPPAPPAPPPMGAPPAPGGAPPVGGMPPPGGMSPPMGTPPAGGLVPPPMGMPPAAMPGQIATPSTPFTPPGVGSPY